MREIYKGGVTPQQKLVGVNNKFGNTTVKDQQGTSRMIYDTLAVTTGTTYRFFEDSAARVFPFTNTGSEGNKLGVGDTMVVESIAFQILTIDNLTGQFTSITNGFTQADAALGMLNFEIANNRVIKNLTGSEGFAAYNKQTSRLATDLELETQIVIPPLLPFVLEIRLPEAVTVPPGQTGYLQAVLIGTGGIIAPRTTF